VSPVSAVSVFTVLHWGGIGGGARTIEVPEIDAPFPLVVHSADRQLVASWGDREIAPSSALGRVGRSDLVLHFACLCFQEPDRPSAPKHRDRFSVGRECHRFGPSGAVRRHSTMPDATCARLTAPVLASLSVSLSKCTEPIATSLLFGENATACVPPFASLAIVRIFVPVCGFQMITPVPSSRRSTNVQRSPTRSRPERKTRESVVNVGLPFAMAISLPSVGHAIFTLLPVVRAANGVRVLGRLPSSSAVTRPVVVLPQVPPIPCHAAFFVETVVCLADVGSSAWRHDQ